MLTIKTELTEIKINDHKGKLLSELISDAGIPLDLRCSGKGICGRCLVSLNSGTFENPDGVIKVTEGNPEQVKSCTCTSLDGDAEIFVPATSMAIVNGRIDEHFKGDEEVFCPAIHILTVELPEPSQQNPTPEADLLIAEVEKQLNLTNISCNMNALHELPYQLEKSRTLDICTIADDDGNWTIIRVGEVNSLHGVRAVAVDVGTTTIAAILLNPFDGEILDRASSYNQQMRNGDNVATRISFASESPKNLRLMQRLVLEETIDPLLRELCETTNTDPKDIIFAAFAGNTVMTHLLLGISPKSIGALPFTPVTNIYPPSIAADINLVAAPDAVIQCVPSISGYIGGDLTAGIAVTELDKAKGITALIDIGTNSETVLCDNGALFTCAAAAGPAFEGAGVGCGMRAADGAIERISINANLDFDLQVIGKCKPKGVCGSAMIDFLAAGFKSGLIDTFGRYDLEKLRSCGRYLATAINGNEIHACILSGNTADDIVYISESDIEQILKAKGAVYAGLKTLLSVRDKTFADLDKIYLAGGFARFIDISNAITIGMLPEAAAGITEKIGNSALAGAYRRVTDCHAAARFREVIKEPQNISLNSVPDFEMNYIEALAIPNFNPEDFPSSPTTV
jgi:uncharacterized 2Fe-2S/4Fe-4S cluster protein (DUF4445 family)